MKTFPTKMPFPTKGQITSAIAAVTGAVMVSWDFIKPELTTIMKNTWFDHHPMVRAMVVIAALVIAALCRSLLPSKSGIPGQDKTVTSTITPPAS